MKLPVIFSQRDQKWASDLLGNSKVTFGKYGCLLDSYAIVLRYWGVDIDPKRLNAMVAKAGGTDGNGALYWATMTKLFPNYTQRVVDAQNRALTDAELQEVTDAIAKGIPVIIQVDMVPATSKADMHFVVGFDYASSEISIADPWTGQAYALRSKYGQSNWTLKRAIYRYVIFQPKELPKPSIMRDEDALKEAKKHPMLQKWAEAIRQHEGWFDGSVSQRCNNAGNIRFTDYTKKYLGAVSVCPTANFAYFRTADEGMEGLLIHLFYAATGQLKSYRADMTLLEFYEVYAPSADGNAPATYAKAVADHIGVTTKARISSFVASSDADVPKPTENVTTEQPDANASELNKALAKIEDLTKQIVELKASLEKEKSKRKDAEDAATAEEKKRASIEQERDAYKTKLEAIKSIIK